MVRVRKINLSPFLSSQASGRINLISEKMVCPSCSDIVNQFRERYPNIQLNIFTMEK
ncbi:deaminase domain-containing protein [Pseudomonas nitroreducens]